MNIKDIKIEDYSYNLPDERIAKYPLANRSESKLLVYNPNATNKISQYHFRDIVDILDENFVLLRNDTKVIRARLLFYKDTGAKIEVFCLDPYEPNNYELSLSSKESCVWNVMIGNAKKWKGDTLKTSISIADETFDLNVEKVSDNKVRFFWNNSKFSFAEILDAMGILPIPPYLNRETEGSDLQTYQTVYANHSGSVAAPTAGLHFTEQVNKELQAKGVDILNLTLHVGAGTFRPVKSEKIGDHNMHSEAILVDRDTIISLKNQISKTITAVGTTSVRTLESLYQFAKIINSNIDFDKNNIIIDQWFAYDLSIEELDKEKAIDIILKYMDNNAISMLSLHTEIMIAPSYRWGFVDAMITNFHQPNSTLLLLVSAFTNGNWQEIYDYAMNNDFRFLSYGDSSILFRK